MRKIGLAIAVGTVLLVTGCSSKTETIIVYDRVYLGPEDRDYIHKEETMDWTEDRKLGAADHRASLIHVLGERKDPFDHSLRPKAEILEDLEKIKSEGSDTKGKIAATRLLSELEPQMGKDGISYYDEGVWIKFCNGGEGLSDSQILQIHLEGAEKMPSGMIKDCNPPKISIKKD